MYVYIYTYMYVYFLGACVSGPCLGTLSPKRMQQIVSDLSRLPVMICGVDLQPLCGNHLGFSVGLCGETQAKPFPEWQFWAQNFGQLP